MVVGRADERILVFVPMCNCEPQIGRTLAQLADPRIAPRIDGVVCVDHRSTDGGAEAAAAALASCAAPRRWLLRNDENYGLGGSHKVAIDHAMRHGFTHLIVLHGDDQGSIADIATSTS